MQIVIDIPDLQYENLCQIVIAGEEPLGYFERVIMRGTPLPKGHGRLIDADKAYILDIFTLREFDGQFIRLKDLDKIPTIIEKEENKNDKMDTCH